MQIAQIVACTEAEGPGKRFAIWMQGCPLRCPGCCNPEMLSFAGGEDINAKNMASQVIGVEGVTLLGGEPVAHAATLIPFLQIIRSRGLSVMIFTGYTIEEVRLKPLGIELLSLTDILVDGRYERSRPEKLRRWIGSANQRIHFLTERYKADDSCWELGNTLEIRLRGLELSINGFPAEKAQSLWKR